MLESHAGRVPDAAMPHQRHLVQRPAPYHTLRSGSFYDRRLKKRERLLERRLRGAKPSFEG